MGIAAGLLAKFVIMPMRRRWLERQKPEVPSGIMQTA